MLLRYNSVGSAPIERRAGRILPIGKNRVAASGDVISNTCIFKGLHVTGSITGLFNYFITQAWLLKYDTR